MYSILGQFWPDFSPYSARFLTFLLPLPSVFLMIRNSAIQGRDVSPACPFLFWFLRGFVRGSLGRFGIRLRSPNAHHFTKLLLFVFSFLVCRFAPLYQKTKNKTL
jgi:hypothetical protein